MADTQGIFGLMHSSSFRKAATSDAIHEQGTIPTAFVRLLQLLVLRTQQETTTLQHAKYQNF